MLYLATNGVCCCMQICCKQLWETLYKLVGKQRFLKSLYCLIHLLSILACTLTVIILKDWGGFMGYFAPGIKCFTDADFNCISSSTLYRISLCLFIFDLIMVLVLSLCNTRVGLILNEGLFCTKIVIVLILFIVSLQIPNSFFMNFGNVSQILSYIFLVYQSIILIDLGYLWGINWAQQYAEGRNYYAFLLIGFTVIMYLSAIVLNVYGYTISKQLKQENACPKWPIITSSVCLVAITLVQLLNFNKQNSLLTTSAISIYVSYWAVAAVHSQPSCFNLTSNVLYIHSSIALVFLLLTTAGSIYGSSIKQGANEDFIELTDNNIPQKKQKVSPEQTQNQRKIWIKWHCYMAVASLYAGMLLTDWGSADIVNQVFNQTFNAFFSKVFVVLLTTILYTWTLIAPRLLPDRNFIFQ